MSGSRVFLGYIVICPFHWILKKTALPVVFDNFEPIEGVFFFKIQNEKVFKIPLNFSVGILRK